MAPGAMVTALYDDAGNLVEIQNVEWDPSSHWSERRADEGNNSLAPRTFRDEKVHDCKGIEQWENPRQGSY
jgi:hypothetical protein